MPIVGGESSGTRRGGKGKQRFLLLGAGVHMHTVMLPDVLAIGC